MSGVSDPVATGMGANIFTVCSRCWPEKNVKSPTKKRYKQNRTQETSLDYTGTNLACPKPINDQEANDLVENQKE
jgi:hypothetical protein